MLALVLLLAGTFSWLAWGRGETDPVLQPATQTGMSADAWSGMHGSAGATRSILVEPALGSVRWRQALNTTGALPLLADEHGAYLAFTGGRISALSSRDGRERWGTVAPGPADAPLILAGNVLIAALRNGVIVAYERGTGAVAWSTETKQQQIAAPIAASGVLWTSPLPELGALDVGTGRALWQSERGWDLRVRAIAVAGPSVAVAALRDVFLLDPRSGAQRYFLRVGDPLFVAATDTVVVAASKRVVVALEHGSRRPWWESARAAWNWAYAYQIAPAPPSPPRRWVVTLEAPPLAPALDGRRLYVADAAAVRAFSLEDGSLLWTHTTFVAVPPIVTSSGVLLGTRDGLLLLDAESGAVLREQRSVGTRPTSIAVVRGATYVTTESEIVALGMAD